MEANTIKEAQTIYTVPMHVGQNIEALEGSRIVSFYSPDGTRHPAQRFRLVEDDGGHWYVIPADTEEEFNIWVVSAVEDDDFDPDLFGEFRLSGSPSNLTFTDPITED